MEGEEKQEGTACAKRISTSRALADTRASSPDSCRRDCPDSSGSLSIRRDATSPQKKLRHARLRCSSMWGPATLRIQLSAHKMHAKSLAATA